MCDCWCVCQWVKWTGSSVCVCVCVFMSMCTCVGADILGNTVLHTLSSIPHQHHRHPIPQSPLPYLSVFEESKELKGDAWERLHVWWRKEWGHGGWIQESVRMERRLEWWAQLQSNVGGIKMIFFMHWLCVSYIMIKSCNVSKHQCSSLFLMSL